MYACRGRGRETEGCEEGREGGREGGGLGRGREREREMHTGTTEGRVGGSEGKISTPSPTSMLNTETLLCLVSPDFLLVTQS